MATVTWSGSTGSDKQIGLNTKGTVTWYSSEWASTISSIPKYSKINSTTLKTSCHTGTGNATCTHKVGSSQVGSFTLGTSS